MPVEGVGRPVQLRRSPRGSPEGPRVALLRTLQGMQLAGQLRRPRCRVRSPGGRHECRPRNGRPHGGRRLCRGVLCLARVTEAAPKASE